MLHSDAEKYRAVLENNATCDGVFYYAVTSTGIYCRPSCPSRAPKRENTVFFNTAQEAERAGFRPCKRCRSDLQVYAPDQEIAAQLKSLLDAQLASAHNLPHILEGVGLSYRQASALFKRQYGLSPKAYFDEWRIETAQARLRDTNDAIIDIAYSLGFHSLSAFYRLFAKKTNTTPAAYRKECSLR